MTLREEYKKDWPLVLLLWIILGTVGWILGSFDRIELQEQTTEITKKHYKCTIRKCTQC